MIALVLVACDNVDTGIQDFNTPSQPTSVKTIFLSKAQLANADIEYGKLSQRMLSHDVHTRGELVLPVNAKADMVCLYPGTVKSVYVNHGDPVKKSQVVAVINSPAYINAQQEYLMAKNQLVMLELEYERQKNLNKDKISSDKFYQRAKADYEVAMAEMEGLKLQLEMAGTASSFFDTGKIGAELKVVCPLNGYIENIDINPGKYVGPDESLMQVINRDKLLVEMAVFEKDILKIRPGQRITFSLSNLNTEVHEARLISVGNSVQDEARIVRVIGEFENKAGRFLPGMFVAGEIHTGEDMVQALPEEALLRMGDDKYIIFYTNPSLQSDTGTVFHYAAVKTGHAEDGFIQVNILSPLPENTLIVIAGGYFIKTEMAKQNE